MAGADSHQILVVYDPDQRYRQLCLEMANERRVVVDVTESSIESRAQALAALQRLGEKGIEQLLVYVPVAKALEDEARQKDPFALYAACGAIFPDSDGDEYLNLCLKAKPDHATQIRSIFEKDANPSFAVIDAVGGGLEWPNLRALLDVESSRDILFALLVPSERQQDALKTTDAWVAEVKTLLLNSIGLKLRTRAKSWSAIADELWSYLLFSEFAFDLPAALPEALDNIPHAPSQAAPLIEDLCERLRSDRRTQPTYIDRAESIESDLELVEYCKQMFDLGQKDTFPFEERTFMLQALQALQQDDSNRVRDILGRHAHSVWTGKGESQAQWDLLRSALMLLEACEQREQELSSYARSMEALLEFYVCQLRDVDRLHREFEQAVSDYDWQDTFGVMEPIKLRVRQTYGRLIEKVQIPFTKHLEQGGWPVSGYLSNNEVFDKLVAPKLQQSGQKVAYLMVDALRYELGVALEQQLKEDGKVELKPALVQLPSITLVGMASLLPDAASSLTLKRTDSGMVPMMGEQPISTVAQRMEWVRKRYGQRFQEGRLEDFVRNKFGVDETTELLILRSVEIDSHFENHPDTAPNEILNALKRIRVAVHKLQDKGFNEVVIATDHGFFMNTHAGAGDTCQKLQGNWLNTHERCLLGEGAGDGHHYQMSAEKAGIRGDFSQLAGPRSMAAYRSGLLYYHGGASLQECVVPVLEIQLKAAAQPAIQQASVVLSYKNGAKRITTPMPVIELSVETQDMFSVGNGFEVLLEAQDKKGEVVGEAKPGGAVNAATGSITLQPGEKAKIMLRMQKGFEGKFKVKALNPTTLAVYCQLELETDYLVV
ncbi:PglZ domain-containing protein [Marinobacterium sedimentorum]|uniref:PglZ domain-containing protein n=1 Tax=Marinobacterium sedimentorum TaxID=2927804 RepID=UPI0020C671B0|nr:PglZ domain-containing protein [Marinobacterium sedimentorum]MCP8687154.1 PglZ domain-containing protein [Marinobacterium sedimentorum]